MVPQRDAPTGWLTKYNAIAAILFVQVIAGLIWAAHTDADVMELKLSQAMQDARMNALDTQGTRRLAVVEDRQQSVLREIAEQRMQLERLGAALRDLERRMPSRP